jgi:elongation factor G
VVDLRARLVDGDAHPKDSSALAFEIAASLALRAATERAGLLRLEPVMLVEVMTPGAYLGDVLGDLGARRAQVRGLSQRGADQVVESFVPLAELWGYAASLRALTQGRGTFLMQPSHYDRAPG